MQNNNFLFYSKGSTYYQRKMMQPQKVLQSAPEPNNINWLRARYLPAGSFCGAAKK
jgi:hypothetical protein